MKTRIHFASNHIVQATHSLRGHLIGAGGTGSQVLTALARINHSLKALGQAGFSLTLWDDDCITEANLGRQLFAASELGLYKSQALIARTNRFFGTDWKAKTTKYTLENNSLDNLNGDIFITCVDSVPSRFAIVNVLKNLSKERTYTPYKPIYWVDFGNSRDTGQVILSTIAEVKQPTSEQYEPVSYLPLVTDEFADLLIANQDDTPSCSLAEALQKQDLFINSTLAQMGSSLLWTLLSKGYTLSRGFFLNLKDFRSQPLLV